VSNFTTDEVVPLILVCNEEYWLPYVLESIKGKFGRYIIYDVGSVDTTRQIISWFIDSSPKEVDIHYRKLPMCEPVVQGTFRNAMIAEARSEWYMLVDGDEIYTPNSLHALIDEMDNMKEWYISKNRSYGVVRRVEITEDLSNSYGQDLHVSHHRIYHRKMTWVGTHPGEAPLITQNRRNEHWFSKKVICYHMHNCSRSTKDEEVPSRIKRRSQGTYHPGEVAPMNLLAKVPILRQPIENFPVSPTLAELQNNYK
jgi:glycosyltransferase involved in cell wall biosynthesis